MDSDTALSAAAGAPLPKTATPPKKKKSNTIIWIIIAIIIVVVIIVIIGLIIWLIVRNNGSTTTPSPTGDNGSLCTADSDCTTSNNCAPNATGIGLSKQSFCQPTGISKSGTSGSTCIVPSSSSTAICGSPYFCNPLNNTCVLRVPIPLLQNPPAKSIIAQNYQCYRQGNNTTWVPTNNNQVVGWVAVNLSTESISISQANICSTCTTSSTSQELTCSSIADATLGTVPAQSTVLWTDTLNNNLYGLPLNQGTVRFQNTQIQMDLSNATNPIIVQNNQMPLTSIDVQTQWYLFVILPKVKSNLIVVRVALSGQLDSNTVENYLKLGQSLQ